jgi:cell division protein YceG involved in septum cleavage
MRIDADITLCYGLAQSYKSCTPSFIAKNISDTNNVFNTRQKTGLTPMPIANPSVTSIKAVLMFEPSDYLFYLHDNE